MEVVSVAVLVVGRGALPDGVPAGDIPAGTDVVVVAAPDGTRAADALAAAGQALLGSSVRRTAVYVDEQVSNAGALPPALVEFCREVFGSRPGVVVRR